MYVHDALQICNNILLEAMLYSIMIDMYWHNPCKCSDIITVYFYWNFRCWYIIVHIADPDVESYV